MSFYINLWHTGQTPADILSCFSYSVCCTRTQTHVHRHTCTDAHCWPGGWQLSDSEHDTSLTMRKRCTIRALIKSGFV